MQEYKQDHIVAVFRNLSSTQLLFGRFSGIFTPDGHTRFRKFDLE